MPTKTIITKVTVGVKCEDTSRPERLAPDGTVLEPALTVTKHIAPGEPVTLDADEADRILARWGGEVVAEEPDEVDETAPEPRRRGRPRKNP